MVAESDLARVLGSLSLEGEELDELFVPDMAYDKVEERYQFSLVGRVLTKKKFHVQTFKDTVRNLWGVQEGVQVLDMGTNLFHFVFNYGVRFTPRFTKARGSIRGIEGEFFQDEQQERELTSIIEEHREDRFVAFEGERREVPHLRVGELKERQRKAFFEDNMNNGHDKDLLGGSNSRSFANKENTVLGDATVSEWQITTKELPRNVAKNTTCTRWFWIGEHKSSFTRAGGVCQGGKQHDKAGEE
ncbi:hypothetical protein LIER_42294 [Lithospermum erythrorhizon]|uniref:DUF4283 domain-containing protein n=1 Tax=Lithospermum erythrorhizon TaxID=34254 RepID=A0AAV3RMR8_LITER